MCVSPTVLINRYNHDRHCYTGDGMAYVVHGNGRVSLSVPCGHCWQCLQAKTDSWVFRCTAEYEACNKNALFVTLTYDDEHLPLHPYVSAPREFPRMVSVWDKKACQKYIKKVHEKIRYTIGTSLGLQRISRRRITDDWRDFCDCCPYRFFSYVLTCERGSFDAYISDSGKKRFGTGRPHYHGIFFIYDTKFQFRGNTYNIFDFFSLDSLQQLFVELWSYGSAYPLVVGANKNKLKEFDRSPLGAIRYVCKYIAKDCTFDYKDIKLKSLIWANHEQKVNSLPFTLFSNGLGLSWFYTSDFRDNYIKYMRDGVTVYAGPSKTRQINVPLYYLNRIRFASVPVDSFEIEVPVVREYDTPYTSSIQHYKEEIVVKKFISKIQLPTLANDIISRDIVNRKAQYYCDLLSSLRMQHPISVRALLIQDKKNYTCERYNELHSRLNSINLDDFYIFITDRLYTLPFNDLVSDDRLYTLVFELLQDYNNIKKTRDYEQRRLNCKQNLSSAMEESPNLFNVTPYKTLLHE